MSEAHSGISLDSILEEIVSLGRIFGAVLAVRLSIKGIRAPNQGILVESESLGN